MMKAIDTLIFSIKADITLTEGPVMQNFLGPTEQSRRMREYRKQLTRALRHKRREDELYG